MPMEIVEIALPEHGLHLEKKNEDNATFGQHMMYFLRDVGKEMHPELEFPVNMKLRLMSNIL